MKLPQFVSYKQMGEFPDVRSDRIAALEAQAPSWKRA
jgi:hypothetical protein